MPHCLMPIPHTSYDEDNNLLFIIFSTHLIGKYQKKHFDHYVLFNFLAFLKSINVKI